MRNNDITVEVKVELVDERSVPKPQATAMQGTRRLFGKWFSDTEKRGAKKMKK